MGTKKARTHKAAGIKNKVPSTPLYVKDILSDPAYTGCSHLGRGVWSQCLYEMMLDKNSYQVSGTTESLARRWGMNKAEALKAIQELFINKTCDIEIENFDVSRLVTECHNVNGHIVTLTNRRRQRAEKARKQARLRKQRQRKEELSRTNTGAVQTKKVPPSSSSSFSPSLSKDKGGALTPFALEVKIKQLREYRSQAKELEGLFESQYKETRQRNIKTYPEKWARLNELKIKIKQLESEV